MRTRLEKALAVLDTIVQSGKLPVDEAIKLKAPYIPLQGWGEPDRVLTIVGLEAVRRANPKGLSSVLGCFWFAGEASYVRMFAVPYDFGNFGTADLADSVARNCFRLSGER